MQNIPLSLGSWWAHDMQLCVLTQRVGEEQEGVSKMLFLYSVYLLKEKCRSQRKKSWLLLEHTWCCGRVWILGAGLNQSSIPNCVVSVKVVRSSSNLNIYFTVTGLWLFSVFSSLCARCVSRLSCHLPRTNADKALGKWILLSLCQHLIIDPKQWLNQEVMQLQRRLVSTTMLLLFPQ